jgi:hypothetical protein
VGAGVYFGLRARAPDAAVSPAVETTQGKALAPKADVGAATAEVKTQLEAAHASLRDKCWTGSDASKKTDHASFVFESSFDRSGRQIVRTVNPATLQDPPNVAICLLASAPPFAIAPQGPVARVRVVFALP